MFWEFAERLASMVISLCVKENETVTPFEKLFEKKPSIKLIRTFGCHSFAHIPKDKRKKTDLVSRPGIYLGPAKNINKYLYNAISDSS